MKFIRMIGTLAVPLAIVTSGAPAFAQVARTWVSGTGDDGQACTRAAPCKTFLVAYTKTSPGGEIDCVDAGGFGTLTITRALSIVCSSGVAAVLASGGNNGITIAAGASDQVLLDGLYIEGIGSASDGVSIQSAAEVVIKNTTVRHFGGNGVTIATTSPIRAIIRNSVIGENGGSGVVVNSSPGLGHVRIFESMIVANASDGIQVNGAGNEAIISNDQILANVRQLNISDGVSGGVVYSLGNNVVPNSSGDSPTAIPLK